jgi:hypothetical protein
MEDSRRQGSARAGGDMIFGGRALVRSTLYMAAVSAVRAEMARLN